MRLRLYSLINIAKNKLQIDEEDYRAIIKRIAQQESLKNCSIQELDLILDEMKKKGFKVTPKKKNSKSHISKVHNKALSLWIELADKGIVQDRSDTAFNKYCLKFSKVSYWRFMTQDEASTVIESLKAWLKRETKGG